MVLLRKRLCLVLLILLMSGLAAAEEVPEAALYRVFTQACTGYAGTAGTTLKHAQAAVALLNALTVMEADTLTTDALAAAIDGAASAMPEEAQMELRENLVEGILPLLNEAFANGQGLPAAFEDAGLYDDMAALMRQERTAACWQALLQALQKSEKTPFPLEEAAFFGRQPPMKRRKENMRIIIIDVRMFSI